MIWFFMFLISLLFLSLTGNMIAGFAGKVKHFFHFFFMS